MQRIALELRSYVFIYIYISTQFLIFIVLIQR
jgi:hypothetical protein